MTVNFRHGEIQNNQVKALYFKDLKRLHSIHRSKKLSSMTRADLVNTWFIMALVNSI